MELVTVKTFENITQSSLVQSYLEAEGIECFVQGENMGQLFGFGDPFSIRLQVRDSDASQAIALLIEGGFASESDYK